MAEYVSLTRQIMRSELAAQRQRVETDRAGKALLMAGEKLVLKQRRALVLASTPPPASVASPPAFQWPAWRADPGSKLTSY
jgi:hypothetical protein